MTNLEHLQEEVAGAYDVQGMPSWPDPHPAATEPRHEEYSRVSDPGKYLIVHARARAWADCLAHVPGVEVETLLPAPVDDEGRLGSFDRGVRLTSDRPGTLSLRLLESDSALRGRDATMAVLHIGIADPPIALETLPDCGCDACDNGSADLLRAVDETVSQVVDGPFVVLLGKGWCVRWHPEGGSGAGERRGIGFDKAMDLCRRIARGEEVRMPRHVTAYVGRSWLD